MRPTTDRPWSLVFWDELEDDDVRVPTAVAAAWLDAWMQDPARRGELFEIWEALTESPVRARGGTDWMELNRVLKPMLTRALETGQLAVITDEGKEAWRRVQIDKPPAEAAPPKPSQAPKPTKTWIEFLIQDADENPLEDLRYRAVLPGGEKKEGKTGKNGLVRFEDLDPGLVEFLWLDLDETSLPSGAAAKKAEEKSTETDFLEFVLENTEGKPVADAEYELKFADGTKRTGKTGEDGLVRHNGIPKGEVEIVFSGLGGAPAESSEEAAA